MTNASVVLMVWVLILVNSCSMKVVPKYPFPKPQSFSAGFDSAIEAKQSPDRTVCLPVEAQIHSQTDTCFSLNIDVHWYLDNPYPQNYSTFFYRQFGACPPYTYYSPDCDCCRRAVPLTAGNVTVPQVEEKPVHSMPQPGRESPEVKQGVKQ